MNRVLSAVRSLTARLVLLLTLALLPLGLISLYQTQQVIRDAQRVTRSSLLAETVAVTHVGRELIQEALGAAQGLGVAGLAQPVDACSRMMAEFVEHHRYFSFAGLISSDLRLDCNSAASPLDASTSPLVQAGFEENRPYVDFVLNGTFSGEAVTIAAHPVSRGDTVLGMALISIPHRFLNEMVHGAAKSDDIHVATINSQGEVVMATGKTDVALDYLPRDIPLQDLVVRGGQTFEAISQNGEWRYYAVDSVLRDSVVMVGSRPLLSAATTIGPMQSGLALAFPILMWVAGIGVAWLGLQRLVVRHIRALRSALRRFALGDRSNRELVLEDDPPEELAEAALAFSRMARIITEGETRQQNDLRDKEVLLREVHHRVKNNLQLIASIMNMQMRTAKSDETRHMLEGLQRRVRGLATLHRTLYTSLDMTTVDGGDIVRAVIHDVAQGALPQGVRLTVDVTPTQLYPDQAVPLSMLVAEALTNALKYVGRPDGSEARIRVTLNAQEDESLLLRISNTKGVPVTERIEDPAGTGGLGQKLMQAFVMQIDGHAKVSEDDDHYICDVTFVPRDFDNSPG